MLNYIDNDNIILSKDGFMFFVLFLLEMNNRIAFCFRLWQIKV